jgi:hypothetical protein
VNINKDDVTWTLGKTWFDIKLHNWKQKNYRLACNRLSKEIIPEDSYFKPSSSGLTIFLKKKEAGEWENLERKKKELPAGITRTSNFEIDDEKDSDPGMDDFVQSLHKKKEEQMKRMQNYIPTPDDGTGWEEVEATESSIEPNK